MNAHENSYLFELGTVELRQEALCPCSPGSSPQHAWKLAGSVQAVSVD